MNKVKALIQGYAKQIKNGWLASSTVTLVQSNGKNIIIDPGCNRKKLIEELKNNNLKPEDIDFVLLTHNHTDHTLLTGIFDNAKVLNNEEIYDNDKQIEHNNKISETDLEIIDPKVIAIVNALETYQKEGVHYVGVVVLAKEFWGEVKNNEPDYCEELIWCDPRELPQPHFDGSRLSIECYLKSSFYEGIK